MYWKPKSEEQLNSELKDGVTVTKSHLIAKDDDTNFKKVGGLKIPKDLNIVDLPGGPKQRKLYL